MKFAYPRYTRESIIAGNHDLALHIDYYEGEHRRWDRAKQDVEQILELLTGPRARAAGLVYLQDSSHTFQTNPNGRTWSVCGSPYDSLEFFNSAFNYPREEGEALVAKFPKTNILLTHGPPSKIFDRTRCGDLVGCEAFRARLPSLRPRLHIFGHIHGWRGAYVHAWAGDGTPASEPLEAQNEDGDDLSDEEVDLDISFDDEEGAKGGGGGGEGGSNGDSDDGGENGTEATRSTPGGGEEEEREETLFVNAATFPAGLGVPGWAGGRSKFDAGGLEDLALLLRCIALLDPAICPVDSRYRTTPSGRLAQHVRKFEHCSDRANNEVYGTTDVSNVNDSASVPSTRVVVPCTSVCYRDAGETKKNDTDIVIFVAVRNAVTKANKGGFKDTPPELLLSHVLRAA
ncbi:putative calcineurin-like phosphoesterase [Lyophyllum shimeji]|uniref:Calcineurin-like phosphoesterase n=1 Tax=Lyophyllum shimeji TaxID=47721 RepID=A0A9P3PUQ1_LYOSH|nr:putative calcineurin-like phosphoesterase [Lyophyllum shimeji]